MTELMQASQQWATRPPEERYTSLYTMRDHFAELRAASRGKVVASREIRAVPQSDHRGLVLEGKGGQAAPTHWAFGQLAQRAEAPASYLRSLPAELAADCINYGLHVKRTVEDLGVLLTRDRGMPSLRAVTGPNYGRIWNADILAGLTDVVGDGVSGQYRVPGEFGQQVGVTRENTTLYASDHDMFVFLADEENRISVSDRRDGASGSLARGFFTWNSEVGDTTFGIGFFLFDYVCANRIVWGAREYKEIKIRHTVSAPSKYLSDAMPLIRRAVHDAPAAPVEMMIRAAQQKQVDDLEQFLAARKFTRGQVEGIIDAHQRDEGRPMASLWDVTTGITAYARQMSDTSERVRVERIGGSVLALAA